MTEPTNPPYPQQRTPEQHAAVRRRALPIAISAVILGVAGLAWMLATPVTAFRPPNPYAINFSFCAMLFGVGIIFYAKGTPGNRAAITLCILAILTSLFGPLIFSKQVVDYHRLGEARERANVEAIAAAARAYASAHDNRFPPDLLTLLLDQHLPIETLRSPLSLSRDPRDRTGVLSQLDALLKTTPRDQLLTSVETESDYLYLGGDLHDLPPDSPLAKNLLVAASTRTILRINLAVAFADAHSQLIQMDEVQKIMEDNNSARKALGLGALRPPPIIQHAIDEATTQAQSQLPSR